MAACDEHLRRPWLLGRLDAHLETRRAHIATLLSLEDTELIAAVGGRARDDIAAEHRRWCTAEAAAARRAAARCGLTLICRCDPQYPGALQDLDGPPSVLHVAGDPERFAALCDVASVAIVGARRSTPYGDAVAFALARRLASAGTTVISGMAAGIDTQAHLGALRGGGVTIAVLPGSADRAYPRAGRTLHSRVLAAGAVLSEQGPGGSTRRWTFPARNRLIAALSRLVVVVEARERSGALLTAAAANQMGRAVGAVPGMVTSPASTGANQLLADGAAVIRGAQDALDVLYGANVRAVRADERPSLSGVQARIVESLATGADTTRALARQGIPETTSLVELAALELAGRVRRDPGGHFTVIP